MADRALFSVSVTPLETVSVDYGTGPDVLSTEIAKTVGGSGESFTLAGYAGAANLQGYQDQAVSYVDAVHSAGGAALTNAARTNEMVFIKNTGFYFGSGVTELGDASTDHIIVAAKLPAWASSSAAGWTNVSNSGEIQYIELAWLAPGEGIVLKLGATSKSVTQFGAAGGDLVTLNGSEALIFVKTVESDGSAASNGNAVEFLCLT